MSSPLSGAEFLVLQFDPRDANLTLLDDVGYSAQNRADSLHDAQKAAARSAAEGLPLKYVVSRVAVEDTFDASQAG